MVVDSEQDHFAVLYANPLPKPGEDGVYPTLSPEARSRTSITVVVESPSQSDTKLGLLDFVKAYPLLSGRVTAQLKAHGL